MPPYRGRLSRTQGAAQRRISALSRKGRPHSGCPCPSAVVRVQRKRTNVMNSASEIIAQLELSPHPEGGYFRETFRDERPNGGRSHSTAIYFLLTEGDVSRWHRVDSAEVFHFYAGAPLELFTLEERKGVKSITRRVLGPDLSQGQHPQLVVAPHCYQAARSMGAYSLVGCTVSPGFEFEHFEMMDPNAEPALPPRAPERH